MKIDDVDSYTYDAHTLGKGSQFSQFGPSYVWNYGDEIWCNIEGQYTHLVADLGHLAGQDYAMSICQLGIMGTKYLRDTEEPLQEAVELFQGETWQVEVAHIYSAYTIANTLAIDLRQAAGSPQLDFVELTRLSHSVVVKIDSTGV